MKMAYSCAESFFRFKLVSTKRVFSHDVTAAILVSQNNETAAMLVSQTIPVGVELFSYVKTIFCSNTFTSNTFCSNTLQTLYNVLCHTSFYHPMKLVNSSDNFMRNRIHRGYYTAARRYEFHFRVL